MTRTHLTQHLYVLTLQDRELRDTLDRCEYLTLAEDMRTAMHSDDPEIVDSVADRLMHLGWEVKKLAKSKGIALHFPGGFAPAGLAPLIASRDGQVSLSIEEIYDSVYALASGSAILLLRQAMELRREIPDPYREGEVQLSLLGHLYVLTFGHNELQNTLDTADYVSLVENTKIAMSSNDPDFIEGVSDRYENLAVEVLGLAEQKGILIHDTNPRKQLDLMIRSAREGISLSPEQIYNSIVDLTLTISVQLHVLSRTLREQKLHDS